MVGKSDSCPDRNVDAPYVEQFTTPMKAWLSSSSARARLAVALNRAQP